MYFCKVKLNSMISWFFVLTQMKLAQSNINTSNLYEYKGSTLKNVFFFHAIIQKVICCDHIMTAEIDIDVYMILSWSKSSRNIYLLLTKLTWICL